MVGTSIILSLTPSFLTDGTVRSLGKTNIFLRILRGLFVQVRLWIAPLAGNGIFLLRIAYTLTWRSLWFRVMWWFHVSSQAIYICSVGTRSNTVQNQKSFFIFNEPWKNEQTLGTELLHGQVFVQYKALLSFLMEHLLFGQYIFNQKSMQN